MKQQREKEKPMIQKTIYIKGIGSITSVGELNLEESIKSLLKNKYITG